MRTRCAGIRRVRSGSTSRHRFSPAPVQARPSRVNCDMTELADASAEQKVGEAIADPLASIERRRVEHFGADAVPLRPAAERDADLEREERRVATEAKGKSSLHRHRGVLALAVPIIGFVVLALVQLISANGRSAPRRVDGAASIAESARSSRTTSPRPSLAPARPVSVPGKSPSGDDRSRRPSPQERQQHSARRPRGEQRPHRSTSRSAANAAPPELEAEPESSPQSEPAPPESAPAPPAPEPTSSAGHQTAGRSEVETQFGFEQ
jgi:hypothetical protein